jgi:hypothetical protein
LSDDEHAALAAAAGRERLATGAWAAQVLLAAASGTERPEYVQLRETLGTVMHAAKQAQRIGVNLNQAVAALHSGEPPPQLRWYAEAASAIGVPVVSVAKQVRRIPSASVKRS